MRELIRKSPRFFAGATLAGLALRLLFVFASPHITDDSRLYAQIANNWLHQGIYGITDSGQIVPTYIRLPGYPAFLAATFALFGEDNFRAVLLLQVLFDLATCFIVADLGRRIVGNRAARAAYLLAALCPFLANYTAAALTETLEVLFTALALDFAVIGIRHCKERIPRRFAPRNDKMSGSREEKGEVAANGTLSKTDRVPFVFSVMPWIWCGLAVAADISLRPDGGLLLAAIGVFLLVCLLRALLKGQPYFPWFAAGVTLAIFSLGPFIPWTIRNWRVFHRFQPLTSRYANGPDDFVPMGFNRWVKTWMADYVSVEEIYWQEPGAKIDANNLPSRAFDSFEQKEATQEAINWYNETTEVDPELDAQFAALARQRIEHSRFRYYLWLPSLRVADMWLRPRTELLPPDPRWWTFEDDLKWLVLSLGLGAINLAYIVMAIIGIVDVARISVARAFLPAKIFSGLPRNSPTADSSLALAAQAWLRVGRNDKRKGPSDTTKVASSQILGDFEPVHKTAKYLGVFVLFIVLRSTFLGTLENPEPRYTLECYPAIIVCAAAVFREKSV